MYLIDRLRHKVEQTRERPDTIDCKGCGRKILIEGVPLWQKFICVECKKTMRLNAPLFKFRYTPEYHQRKKILTLVTCALISLWGPLWSSQIIYPDGLGHWFPSLGHVRGWGLGHPLPLFLWLTITAAAIAVYLYMARARSSDYRRIGGGMILMLAARRFPLWVLCLSVGHPRAIYMIVPACVAAVFGVSFITWSWWKRRNLPML